MMWYNMFFQQHKGSKMGIDSVFSMWLFEYHVRPSSTMRGVANKVKIIANNKPEASEKFLKYISMTYGDILSLNFYIKDVPIDSTPEVPAWLIECNGGLSEVGAPTLKEATAIIVDWVFDKYPDMSDLSLNIRKMPEKILLEPSKG